MRRLMFLLASAAALLVVASAGATSEKWTLHLGVDPTVVQVGDTITWDGIMLHANDGGAPAKGSDVTIHGYYGYGCASKNVLTWWHPSVVTDDTGYFSFTDTWDDPYPAFSFNAVSYDGAWSEECVDVTVEEAVTPPTPVKPVAPARTPDGIFLCYSAWQIEPGVWLVSVARTLLAAGYWQPYAIKGNIAGGTNVGDYHLVCNLAAGQSVSQQFVGGGGDLHAMSEKVADQLGVYPVVG